MKTAPTKKENQIVQRACFSLFVFVVVAFAIFISSSIREKVFGSLSAATTFQFNDESISRIESANAPIVRNK